jgi:hypothetical protein
MEDVSVWFLSTFGWMEQSPVGQTVRMTPYLYPTLMSLHVVGLVVMLGPALMVDLRLLGLGRRSISVTTATRLLLPISHIGFLIVAITGSAMFTGLVYVISKSAAAPWKLGLIAVAALNIVVFHKGTYRSVERWDGDQPTPIRAKFAASISMLSWTAVIFGGRFLSY